MASGKRNQYKFKNKHPFEAKLCKDRELIEQVSEFSDKKAIFICPKCGREKEYKFSVIAKNGFHCDVCDRTTKKLTKERFEEQIRQAGDGFEVIGEVVSADERVTIKCKKCKEEYEVFPSVFVGKGCQCKFCKDRKFPRTFKTIDKTHPEKMIYFKNKQDCSQYTYGSSKVVDFLCPHCGHEFQKQVKDFIRQKNPCPVCSDGLSYPNKILRQLLMFFEEKLEEYEFEYIIDKTFKKRYDGYLKYDNKKYLVEMQGGQHYKNAWTLLEYQQENDVFKRNLAVNLGYEIIIIDCSSDNFEGIKNSIKNSKLQEFFEMTELDFKSIFINAEKSYVKEAWDMFNSGMSLKQISEKLKVSPQTISNYVKKGESLQTVDRDITQSGHRAGGNRNRRISINVYDENKNFVENFPQISDVVVWVKRTLNIVTKTNYIKSHCISGKPYHNYYFYFVSQEPNVENN